MASKVKSKISEFGSFSFCFDLTCYFSCILLFICTIVLSGCNNTTSGDSVVQTKSANERKAELLKSLDDKFENPDAHFELGKLYHAEKEWSQAEWRYHRALNFDPVHWPAQAAMAKLFIDSRDPAEARKIADYYINKVSISTPQSLELALAFQNEQLDDYAMTCFKQALNLAPNSPEVHKKMGYYYLSRNDKAKAEEHFVLSYRFNNRQPDVAYELGRLGVEVRIPQKIQQNNPANINN